MKTFNQVVNESVVDVTKEHYSKNIFDDNDTEHPILKDNVKSFIMKGIKELSKIAPVKGYYILGSILTKKYTLDSDVDVNVLFDSDDETLEKILKKSSLINGQSIPGGRHPLNFYAMNDNKKFDNANKRADAVYDIDDDIMLKSDKTISNERDLYDNHINNCLDRVDILVGRLNRSLKDYEEVNEMEDVVHSDKIREVVSRLDFYINELISFYERKLEDRRELFKKDIDDLDDDERDKYNRYKSYSYLPKNVIYKIFEKYGYFEYIKTLKDIIGDDRTITRKDVDKIIKYTK